MKNRLTESLARADLANVIGIAVFTGLTLAFAFGVVTPVAVRAHLAVARNEAAARQRQRAGGVAAAVRAAGEEIERTRARLAAAPLQVRPVSALNERLASLVELAGESGLTVQDLKPGEAARGKKFMTTPIRLTGRGTYPGVAAFLHRLHERLPDVSVGGLSLAGAPEDAAVGRYALDLRWIALPAEPNPQVVSAPLQ